MKLNHIKLFETYKSQEELSHLSRLCIKELSNEIYMMNKLLLWIEPSDGSIKLFNVYFVEFKDELEIPDGNHIVEYIDANKVRLADIDDMLYSDDVKLTWAEEVNSLNFTLLGMNIDIKRVIRANKDIIKRLPTLTKFIANTEVDILLVPNNKEGGSIRTVVNEYDNVMEINLNYNQSLKAELSENKIKYSKPGHKYGPDYIEVLLNKKYHTILLHELQHAYDYYRSEGKALDNKPDEYINKRKKADHIRNKDYSKVESKEREFLKEFYKLYLNLPHEINARFTETIDDMGVFINVDIKDSKPIKSMKPIRDIVDEFRETFEGWDILDDKTKKRLVRKVSQFWHYEKEKWSI